jgi:hypothetical protein
VRSLWIGAAALLLAACATMKPPAVVKVEPGQQSVSDKLELQLEGPWNRFTHTDKDAILTWTVEGFAVDRLQFFIAIKDGADIVKRDAKEQSRLTFHSSMQPQEVVALFQGLLTARGSTFTLEKLEPITFLGEDGFRFRYSLKRRGDDVRLAGVGYGAIHQGELTVILYSAPRLGFFPRYEAQIEKMALSARLKT